MNYCMEKQKTSAILTQVNENDLPYFDLFTYSFPCTSISGIGSRKGLTEGSKTASSLLWECKRIIRKVRPKYLLMENVPALLNKNFKPQYDIWLSLLKDMGYTNFYQVLDARDFNVPQTRKRVIGVSVLGGSSFTFPKGQELHTFFDSFIDKRDQYEFIDLAKWGNHIAKNIDLIRERQGKAKHNRELVELYNYKGYKDRKDSFRSETNSRVYSQYGVIPTLTTKADTKLLTDDFRVRKITSRECMRAMGWKDKDYQTLKGKVSDPQIKKQCGNSIVVPVLEGVFKQLF